MAYRVDITERAERDLEHIYLTIEAGSSEQARDWFNGLERRRTPGQRYAHP